MLFPSSSAAAPLLALLLLLAAVSPPGAALELPSPLVDVAVLAMGAEPGSAEALPMNAPQTESAVRNALGTVVTGRSLYTDPQAYEALLSYRKYLDSLADGVDIDEEHTISQLPVAPGVTAQLRNVRFVNAVADGVTTFSDGSGATLPTPKTVCLAADTATIAVGHVSDVSLAAIIPTHCGEGSESMVCVSPLGEPGGASGRVECRGASPEAYAIVGAITPAPGDNRTAAQLASSLSGVAYALTDATLSGTEDPFVSFLASDMDINVVDEEGEDSAGDSEQPGDAGGPGARRRLRASLDCISIGVDTTPGMVADFGSVSALSTYIAQLYAAVSYIFERDAGYRLQLGHVRITRPGNPDPNPFAGDTNVGNMLGKVWDNWEALRASEGVPQQHLVQLLTTDAGGGVAYLNTPGEANPRTTICSGKARTSVAGISGNWNPTLQPVDNLNSNGDLYVVAHELGHNLGSPHTHSCNWYDPPIDNCGASFEDCGGNQCDFGPGDATIMSYCHFCPKGIANLRMGFNARVKEVFKKAVQNTNDVSCASCAQAPTQAPSQAPSQAPTRPPTGQPTMQPTRAPTQAPSGDPEDPIDGEGCELGCVVAGRRTGQWAGDGLNSLDWQLWKSPKATVSTVAASKRVGSLGLKVLARSGGGSLILVQKNADSGTGCSAAFPTFGAAAEQAPLFLSFWLRPVAVHYGAAGAEGSCPTLNPWSMLFLTAAFTDTTGQGRTNSIPWQWSPMINNIAPPPRGYGYPTVGQWTRFLFELPKPSEVGAMHAWNRLQLANFDMRGCALRFDIDELQLLSGEGCADGGDIGGGDSQCSPAANEALRFSPMDVNRDGAVDILDVAALAANITATGGFSYTPTHPEHFEGQDDAEIVIDAVGEALLLLQSDGAEEVLISPEEMADELPDELTP